MRQTFLIPLLFVFSALAFTAALNAADDKALRVLVASTSAEFSTEWTALLKERGAQAEAGAIDEAALSRNDVVLLHSAEFKPLGAEKLTALDAFAKRGGGIVVINGAIAAGDAAWMKKTVGAGWTESSQHFSSAMMLYLAIGQHPIVKDAWSFDVEDETYYDLDRDPSIKVLSSAFTPKVTGLNDERKEAAEKRYKGISKAHIYDLQPQMWVYEGAAAGETKGHRAFVSLSGAPATLKHASIRTFILRGIAWTANRENIDALVSQDELASIQYPAGGPKTPQATVKQFEVHPEFDVKLVASEPLINKPIAIQWDSRGRLWVAETPEYPNGRRPNVADAWKETSPLVHGKYDRPATDRISILSDTNGDGVMDKKTIFYEGLELVTGFCFYKDGVLALHQPDIVFLRDTDGDDKADKQERVLTGFAPGDSHFVANHLTPGYDGWVYVSMGGGENIHTPDKKKMLGRVGSGIFRFKPDGSAIEQVSSKGGNGFGMDLSSSGELFFNQATSGSPFQHVVVPEWTLAKGKVGQLFGANSVISGRKVVRKDMPTRAALMQIDVVGGYSAACASLLYEGGAWPGSFANSIFTTEPILSVIHHEIMKPSGATFTGEMVRPEAEFIYSPDYWFKPIDVATGPDGAIYIVDFYSPVIAHSDTRGPQHGRAGASVRPDRDHYFGRIYRVNHKQATKLDVPDVSKASAAELAAALKHPNRTVRANVFKQLTDKGGADVAAAVEPIAASEEFAPARILALWTLQRQNALKPELLRSALSSKNADVRTAAGLIAEAGGASAVLMELTSALGDADPRAKIAALRALATAELNVDAAATILRIYPTLSDDWTRSATVAAAASSPSMVMRAALKLENPAGLESFLKAVAKRTADQQDAVSFAAVMVDCAAAPATADNVKIAILNAASTLKTVPEESTQVTQALRKLITSENAELASAALPLASTWDKSGALKAEVAKLAEGYVAAVNDKSQPEKRRMELATALIGARATNPEFLTAVAKLLASDAPLALKKHIITEMSTTSDAQTGALLIEAMPKLSPGEAVQAGSVIVSRVDWSLALLDAAEAKKTNLNVLGPSNIFRLRTHPDKKVAERSVKLLNSIQKPDADKAALIAKFLPEVNKPGNVAKGKDVFTANCAACHQFNGQGTAIGPVLTGMGAHGPENLLVHILDPNRAVDAGYEVWNVSMKDGSIQSGLLSQENDAQMVLKTANGPLELAKSNIKTARKTPLSLMPEGLESLGAEGLRDLLAYLCEGNSQYRILDLTQAFTADTRRGLYHSAEQTNDTLYFKKFGIVQADGIPFNIVDPAKSTLGGNLVILKSGSREAFANTYPQKAEVSVGAPVKNLYLLGGVAGWGSPGPREGRVILTLNLHFAGGAVEKVTLRDGVEFIDYPSDKDVPGSKRVSGVMRERQIRLITVPVKNGAVLEKIVMSSPGEGPAATTAAITVELAK